jgi:epoxyqueuosine reductase
MSNDSTTAWISERAKELGFAMCGVVRAENLPELARNGEWLERGFGGEMKYLSDERRADVQRAMPGTKSLIVCALTYNTAYPRTSQARNELPSREWEGNSPRGWISRYAWGDDYHEVLRAKLGALLATLRERCPQQFDARVYTDTGPINERVLAKHAGLGWLGKNTLLLNQQIGSYFFLGVILTALDLESTLQAAGLPPADRCGTCRKCIDACPTQALVEPYVMDARKCISYLTIELRGPIPIEFREAVGEHVFGCDICQDVCPWNRSAPVAQDREFQPRTFAAGQSLFLPNLEWLASMGQQEFSNVFQGSPIKRAKWRGMLRNACIALGNANLLRQSGARERGLTLLSGLAQSQDSMVGESAQWAVSRIQGKAGQLDDSPASWARGELVRPAKEAAVTKSEGQAL